MAAGSPIRSRTAPEAVVRPSRRGMNIEEVFATLAEPEEAHKGVILLTPRSAAACLREGPCAAAATGRERRAVSRKRKGVVCTKG